MIQSATQIGFTAAFHFEFGVAQARKHRYRIETFIESANEEADSVEIKVKLRSLIQLKKNAEELCNNYYAIPNVKDAELTAVDEDLHLLEVRLESLEAVRKDDRLTSETRIVFDAGSHQNNELSLNDCLWPGINLNPNLLDILINFRLNAIAFCSVIKQAFLQICLADEHKDAIRFLWSDDEPCVYKRPKLQVYRFNRVNFGVSSSPFLLAATIRHHIEKYKHEFPDTVELLDRNFYVDDLISGGNEFEEALQTSRRAKHIMEAAGMDLRKWITNDANLMEQWKKENFKVHPVHETVSLGANGTKVLGLSWNTNKDYLTTGGGQVQNFLSDSEFPKNFQQVVPELDYLTEHEKETAVQERKKLLEADRSEETVLLNRDSSSILDELLELSNNYFKVINILSYIFRFNYNCRNKSKKVGPLTVAEFKEPEIKLIKHAQRSLFDKKEIPSSISNLFPFVDGEGIVRVGGRLENASVPYLHKHPAILPKGSKLSKLYFNSLHTKLFHVGPQGLLNAVRQKFWPLSGSSIARKTVHQCVTCFKSRPILSSQIMGNLPSERVNISSPFTIAELDLCGPFLVKYKNQRKGTLNKVYICVCICFSTKAIHLELLSDLTSDALSGRGSRVVWVSDRGLLCHGSDADDFDVLTPGHFLIGRPITSIPEPNLIDVNENRLSRWEKITKVVQRTWKKWKSDYLNTLQARSKWITEKNDLMIGQMVLIKEDFLPINTWPLGRILEVFHGSDGKVRVVKVKTQSGEFKRAISKIAVLPIDTK
ncbi:integrase catalytic domain-containing protein [Trichonephila clavipes]|nr:integrase catalytic domain-containing protein [Trichonephila clavipes]